MRTRSYSEMCEFDSYLERFEYLSLGGTVGRSTFGHDRYLNQDFYRSRDWKSAREKTIIRDNGCDLGVSGYEIHADILVHHMNPIDIDDVIHQEDWILNPEFLITTTQQTHNAIHYGQAPPVPLFAVRVPGDTALW